MEVKLRIVGYGTFEGKERLETLIEVTKRSIWTKSDGGRHEYRTRDGHRIGDNSWAGYRIHPSDLAKVPGRRKPK